MRANLRQACEYDTLRNEYQLRERLGIILSARLLDEIEQADGDAAAEAFDRPLLVISATQYERLLEAGSHFASLAPMSEHIVLEGADHGFSTDEDEERLFATTIDWLHRFKMCS